MATWFTEGEERMAESYTVIPLSPLRKVIAARMTDAKQTIPHFRLVADIEVDALLALRELLNEAHPEAKVSINDCLIKACAWALVEHPAINVQFVNDEIHRYHEPNISVVIAVPDGLSTPVIRHAHRKPVRHIAAEVKALAARAAAGRLRMDELLGGSFTISNLGAYDVDQFDAIINPPQCAILAVGRAKRRILAGEGDDMRIATVLRVTLSLDHRAIDGVTGAAFLRSLRRVVEQPQKLLGDER